MKIQLINGSFDASDALELISQLIQTKIAFHENKISSSDAEEDMKNRENKIKVLQQELADFKALVFSKDSSISLHSEININ